MKKISIISVVYNAVDNIENMIKSVIGQKNIDFEFIIIDGKSNDGTVDIIKKYSKYINYWISETDNGIYNAMNKGIEKATGNYLYFLGADDYLNEDILDKVVQYLDGKIDIVCGKVYLIDNLLKIKKVNGKFLSKKDILNGKMPPHQGMFIKRDLILKYKFNEKYTMASDYELFLRFVLEGATVEFINLIVANYSIEGTSSTNIKKLKEEYIDVLKKYNLDNNIDHFLKYNKEKKWKTMIKSILKVLKLERYIKCYLLGWKNINEY